MAYSPGVIKLQKNSMYGNIRMMDRVSAYPREILVDHDVLTTLKIGNNTFYGIIEWCQFRMMDRVSAYPREILVDHDVLTTLKIGNNTFYGIIEWCQYCSTITREEVGQSISRLTHQHKIRNHGLVYELVL